MFRHESQLGLARTEQYDDQDSRSIKLQCVSCRSSHNTLWRCMPHERTRTHVGASIGAIHSCTFEKPIRETYTRVERQNASPPRIEVVSFPPSQRKGREMHSCGNASCHSRRLPRDNKLSGLCIGRKQRRTFHMQNTCAPQVPQAPSSSSSSWARKPAPSFRVKNDLADNRCSGLPKRQAAPRCHLRPFLIDRFVLIDR